MLGRVPLPGEGKENKIPEFVEDVNHSLKGVYDDVRRKLNEAHQRNKSKCDDSLAATSQCRRQSLALCPCCEAGKNKETVFIVGWPIHLNRQCWCCDLPDTVHWIFKDIGSA